MANKIMVFHGLVALSVVRGTISYRFCNLPCHHLGSIIEFKVQKILKHYFVTSIQSIQIFVKLSFIRSTSFILLKVAIALSLPFQSKIP